MYEIRKQNLQSFVGSHSVEKPTEEQIYKTREIIFHPLYKYGERYDTYDLALVIVDRAIKFGPIVKPICLPNAYDDELFWNREVIVSGKFQ